MERNAAVDQTAITGSADSQYMSKSMHDAIKALDINDPNFKCEDFYRIQSNQDLGNGPRLQVNVHFDFSQELDGVWDSPLKDAILAINEAARGLFLQAVTKKPDDAGVPVIHVAVNEGKGCSTSGHILLSSDSERKAEISLDKGWPKEARSGTAIHEMMHALGFEHEHQRQDRDEHVELDPSKKDKNLNENQYQKMEKLFSLSCFDQSSIMLYASYKALPPKPEAGVQQKTSDGLGQTKVLSELDKVGLNILYRPVKVPKIYQPDTSPETGLMYQPVTSPKTGLMYCGRKNCVLVGDRVCGPEEGANCPACRVLKTEKSVEINQLGKWQGWTGLVYCGKPKPSGNDICGPNKGKPCTECGKLIGYCDDSPEDQDKLGCWEWPSFEFGCRLV